jgi:hypothetical protein
VLASVMAVYAGAHGHWLSGSSLHEGAVPALFTLGVFLCANQPWAAVPWWGAVLALVSLLPSMLLVEFASRASATHPLIAGMARPLSVYLAALALFVGIYGMRLSAVVTVAATSSSAAYLALRLWQWPGSLPYVKEGSRHPALPVDAVVVGVVTGQIAWPLLFWPSPALAGGLALLATFYAASGMLPAAVNGRVHLARAAEYALVGLSGLIVILGAVLLWR